MRTCAVLRWCLYDYLQDYDLRLTRADNTAIIFTPKNIIQAHQANQLYPFAISLIESVRTYERSLEKMEPKQNIALLVAGLRRDVQQLISEGVGLVWESYKLDPYVQRLAEMVVMFQVMNNEHFQLYWPDTPVPPILEWKNAS